MAKRSNLLRIAAGIALLCGLAYAGKEVLAPKLEAGFGGALGAGFLGGSTSRGEAVKPQPDGQRVVLDDLRRHHPTDVERRYANRRLVFRATLVNIEAPNTLILGGIPPAYCQVAPDHPFPPQQAVGESIEIHARFQRADGRGFQFYDCQIEAP